ncbi:MAG TPA: hypothetical protein VGC57_03420 [Cellulomonas sp.]
MQQTGPDRSSSRVVFRALGPDAAGQPAAELDLGTGVLTPARTTWRTRAVVIDRRALVLLQGRKTRVHLAVERANGWRRAVVPLLEIGRDHRASQTVDVLLALADVLESRDAREQTKVVALLREQVQHLERGGDLAASPLTRTVGLGGGGGLSAIGGW